MMTHLPYRRSFELRWLSARHHSRGYQVEIAPHNLSVATAVTPDSVPEEDILNTMVVDPDATHTEPASDPDFIDLTLSD